MPTFDISSSRINRAITIDQPKSMAATRQLKIQASPLPDISKLAPDASKGIEGIIAVVMNPSIRDANDNSELIEFDPPLDITVEYTAADVKATTLDAKGLPRLSLVLGYQAGKVWKYERLKTQVKPNPDGKGGTLRAKLRTLQPADPIFLMRP